MPAPRPRLRARRRLGQHFLVNASATEALVRAFAPAPDDLVLEIGPGEGALTRRLSGRVARLVAVEVDPRLAAGLRAALPEDAPGTPRIVEADILAADLPSLLLRLGAGPERRARVIGNLPYSIASAIILKLLREPALVRDLLIMVQREVAERIVSPPGRKSYGGLSVLCQTAARIRRVLRLGPGSFRPPPRVDSEALHLVLRDPPGVAPAERDGLAALLRIAFAHRRKTLQNNVARLPAAPGGGRPLGAEGAAALLSRAGLDPRGRPEGVPPAGWIALLAAWRRADHL